MEGTERAGQIPRNPVAECHRQQIGTILPAHQGAAGCRREEELHRQHSGPHGGRLHRIENQRRGNLLRQRKRQGGAQQQIRADHLRRFGSAGTALLEKQHRADHGAGS